MRKNEAISKPPPMAIMTSTSTLSIMPSNPNMFLAKTCRAVTVGPLPPSQAQPQDASFAEEA